MTWNNNGLFVVKFTWLSVPQFAPWLAFDKSMTVDGGRRLKRWQVVPRLKEGNTGRSLKNPGFKRNICHDYLWFLTSNWFDCQICFILFLKVDLDVRGSIWNCWCLPRRFGRSTPRRSTSRSLPIVFRHRKLLVVSITATWPRQGPKSTQMPAVSH